MIQEYKQLVLKDLCARLPYNVKVAIDFKSYLELLPDDDDDSEYPYKKNLNTILRCSNKSIDDISQEPHIVYSYIGSERFSMLRGYDNREYGVPVELIKPYLRSLLSMTAKEEREYNGTLPPLGNFMFEQEELFKPIQLYKNIPFELYEFFNSHYFDYRGLIEKGLAIEAPAGMYN